MTSSINQLRMNMLDRQALQISKSNRPIIEDIITNEQEKNQANCQEDICNKSSDFGSYDEYMQYCEENAVSECNLNPSYTFVSVTKNITGETIRPIHIGRALDTYSHFGEENLISFVETEV